MIKKIIILIGLPGSGKGTQGAIISKLMDIPHISTGDIFRKMIKEDSKESELLAKYMKEGKLIPADLVNKVVRSYILSDECKNGCVLDGYPRSLKQAEYFIENISTDIITIFFDLDAETASKRILGRISCSQCGAIYNEYFDKPKTEGECDDCGSHNFSARADDDENTIKLRLEEYKTETLPMVNYYKKKGRFFAVDAMQNKQKITEEVSEIIKKI